MDSQEHGFFGRWSQRKASVRQGGVEPEEPETIVQPEEASVPEEAPADPPQRIDPRTGKPYDELTDEDMPPLETIDQDSDVSMFMAKNISPTLRRQALRRMFHTAKFNKISLCAEYAGDYRNWEPMGDVVPHDWKRAIAREAERAQRKLAESLGEDAPADGAQEATAGMDTEPTADAGDTAVADDDTAGQNVAQGARKTQGET